MDIEYVQTRNEASELTYHTSVRSAMEMAKIDLTIWKISFKSMDGKERIRLVKKGEDWVYEPITFEVNPEELSSERH